uniref:RNA-directed DNA polymerase n=1 Tax=Plectus sambesii TaxID=2011161 RepID=A0A914UTP1_9BILA
MTDRDRSGAARAADGGSGGGEVPSQTDVIAQLMAQMQQQQLMMESMQEELWQLRQQQQPAQPPVLPPAQPPVQPSTQPTVQPPVHPLVQTQLSVQPRLQQIPKPPTFNPKLNDFAAWSTQLDNFFDLYQVEDDRERRRVLMLALSEDVIKVLTALTMGQPQTKSYDELFSLLKDRHVKKVILPMRRDAFLKARQKGSQSVDEWQTEVCKLAVECEFGTLLESMMLTVFLGGLRDDRLRIHLHAKELATLWEAVDAARLYEAQRCLPPDSKQQEQPQDVNALNQRWQGNQRTSKGKGRSQTGSEPDSRRAEPSRQKTQHKEGDKSFKGKCFNCNEYGHRASACKKPKRKKADINSIHALHDSSLAYLTLRAGENKVRLQVDTGAALTVLKQEDWNVIGRPKLMAPSYKARSYSGHAVRFKGEVDLDVLLCGRRRRLKAFVADDAAQSIMGRDWLEQIDGWEQFKEKLKEQPDLELQLLERDESSEQCYTRRMKATLKKYKDVFQPGLGHCTNRTIHLELKQDARPVWCKARPVPFAKKQRAEKELDWLVANGVITPVKHSDWAAPVVLVDKANGEMRICADYSTGLNAALKIDQYPLPRFEDVFEALNGATVFASLDMKDAYLQCELDDDSKCLTTINTHRGLFKYNRLPFGVASAPAAFQLVMDAMLAGQRRAAAYLDDVVLAGKDEDELLKVIDDVLHRFSEYGLRLRRDKCQFFEKRIKFLGFVIDAAGRHPNPEKISAIKEMPAPRDITQLRAFLGLVNFYGSFIPQMSTRTAHLNALLRKDQQWQWTKQAEQEFNSLKKTLTAETLLTHYTPDLPIVVAADASEYGIGGVLLHRMADGSERPIAYVSKALTAAQKNYPQIQKEAL